MGARRLSGSRSWFGATLLVLAVGCALVAFLKISGGEAWISALYVVVGCTALFAWRLFRWPDAWARYFSIGAVLLLACVLNRILFLVDYLLSGPRFGEWPFYTQQPEWALFKGELITILGTMLTVFAWSAFGGLQTSPAQLFRKTDRSSRLLIVLYALSLGGLILGTIYPEAVGALGQLLPTLFGAGLAVSYVIPMQIFRRQPRQLLGVVVASAPFLLAALGTGMKENLIIALLPSAVLAWRVFRNPGLRVGMILLGIYVVGVLTAYVSLYRAEVWQAHVSRSDTEVISDFVGDVQSRGALSVITDGVRQFIKRNNASIHRGWAVSLADEHQFYPDLVFEPLVYVFVPRIFWPEKPRIRQGWEYSGILYGQQYIAWSDSSSAAGLFTSFYLGGGWLAVLVGALGVGVVLAVCTRLCRRLAGTIAAGLYVFSVLPGMLRMDEEWSVGVLSGPILSAVYVIGVFTIAKAIASGLFGARRDASEII